MEVTVVSLRKEPLRFVDLDLFNVYKFVGGESVFIKISTTQSIRLADGAGFHHDMHAAVVKAKALQVGF